MDFMTAVKTCLSKYADFDGRARRSEYWYFALFNLAVSIVASILDVVLGITFLQWVVAAAFLLPSLAVGARRLHDTGRSGWFLLLGLIPLVGAIILIVWLASDSKPGANQYGPNTRGQGDAFGQPGHPGQAPYPGQASYGG